MGNGSSQNGTMKPSRQIKINSGVVEGYRLSISEDKDVDLFLGIPFAKPPIGELRFKKPEHPENWEGVRKCIRFGPRAPQKEFIWEKWKLAVEQSEDCLYLNVFSPSWKCEDDNGRPVLVFVHGGGYVVDSAVKYGAEGIARYLCRHDVVVVTIQYRLGLLGFFSTGDDECPDNLGFWDMTFALQWVKDNISAFSGNPDAITVFGQSAGGASVDFLSISPHSRDLFKQVVPMGGNAECVWSTQTREELVKKCRSFAVKKGWKATDESSSREMLEFLRTLDASRFKRSLFPKKGVDITRIKAPIAPAIGTKADDFLPKSIDELRKEAPRRKIMVGTCEHEALIFACVSIDGCNLKSMDKILNIFIPETVPNATQLRVQAKEMYIKKEQEADKAAVAEAYIKLFGDVFMNNGTYTYAEKMTTLGNKVYMYSFDYYNPKSFGLLSMVAPFKGATHCTELAYIFGVSILIDFNFNSTDIQMLDVMTKMWANFAKYGNPNGNTEEFDFKWEPTSSEHPVRHLKINVKSEMADAYHDKRGEFWSEVQKHSKII